MLFSVFSKKDWSIFIANVLPKRRGRVKMATVDFLSRSPEMSCVLSADQYSALTAAQSLLPTGSAGRLALFLASAFFMATFYHIAADGASP